MLPIFLASTSPRRVFLMEQVGLGVTVVKPDADETPRRGESPRALVSRLSRAKAESALASVVPRAARALIIAADTIVVAPGGRRILGKPEGVDDAKAMLKLLSGKTHTVLTGYCLLEAVSGGKSRRISRVISSRVKMRKLDAAAIARYVATGEPMDKAGSYGAQGLGMALIEEIRGSYTNVVGLPMAQILSDLEKSFGIPIFPEGSLGGAA